MKSYLHKLALLSILSTVFTACSSNDDEAPLVLMLGKPGEIKTSSTIAKNDNVQMLEVQESIKFLQDDGLVEVTHNAGRTFKAGEIIVANQEQRLLLRVTKVVEAGGTVSKLIVRQGRMEDLVGKQAASYSMMATPVYDINTLNGYVQKAQNPHINGDAVYTTDDKGKIVIRNMDLFSIQLNDQGQLQKDKAFSLGNAFDPLAKKFVVSGSAGGAYRAHLNEAVIEVIPTARNDVTWGDWGILKTMQSRLDARVKYKVDISYDIAGGITLEGAIDILPTLKIPLVVPGPVPVYIDIELSVPAGVSIIAQGANKTRIIYEAEYDFFTNTTYDEAGGFKNQTRQNNKVMDKSVVVSQNKLNLSAEFYVKPTIIARVYRVIGPYFYVQPYVRGELEIPQRTRKDDLYVGARGGVGVEFSEPVFTTPVMGYDAGTVNFFEMSWDLDGAGAEEAARDYEKPNEMHITNLGAEGFVVLNAKHLNKNDPMTRFEINKGTKYGILLPSDNFYMDGIIYYYPVDKKAKDSFQITITCANGEKRTETISLNLSNTVLEEVAKDRFGFTTNSYQVASGSPAQFAGEVDHYYLSDQFGMRTEDEEVHSLYQRNVKDRVEDCLAALFKREENYNKTFGFEQIRDLCSADELDREAFAYFHKVYQGKSGELLAHSGTHGSSIAMPIAYMGNFEQFLIYFAFGMAETGREAMVQINYNTQKQTVNLTAPNVTNIPSPFKRKLVDSVYRLYFGVSESGEGLNVDGPMYNGDVIRIGNWNISLESKNEMAAPVLKLEFKTSQDHVMDSIAPSTQTYH